MSKQNIIGQRVRALRIEKELSQDALAAQCNVLGWDISRGTLSKIEAQIRRVNDAEAILLSKALKCSMDELYSRATKADLLAVVRQGRD